MSTRPCTKNRALVHVATTWLANQAGLRRTLSWRWSIGQRPAVRDAAGLSHRIVKERQRKPNGDDRQPTWMAPVSPGRVVSKSGFFASQSIAGLTITANCPAGLATARF